ncbi:DUF2306 domain-containing protein [Bacillus methanolicus]|uniref:DUF2306 domain-containing protein n=1 Tax=Bacillus methanolicus TaxID=1471 RepID=UPI0023806B8A|nr:DUF2306 domain-containing protein [Bacillus methanolicus]
MHLLEGIHYDSWIIFLKMHIAGGVMALALGPFQFSKRIQAKRRIHRFIGKVYIFSILLGGLAGFYVSSTALGGVISMVGFLCLNILWLYTTYIGYKTARKKKIELHQRWMLRSYALTFAGVTLRLWTILLTFLFADVTKLINPTAVPSDFLSVYRLIAWICWIPNLFVIELYIRFRKQKSAGKSSAVSLTRLL